MKSTVTLLLLVLSISLFAQRSKRTDFDYNNRFDINVQFVGLEFDYKHKLIENFNLGIGIGGLVLTNVSLTGESIASYAEFAKIKIFLEYDQLKNFRFYAGPKLVGVAFWESDTFTDLKGIEIGMFTRGRRIEFGVELSLVESDGFRSDSKRLMTSLLVVKIPISRW